MVGFVQFNLIPYHLQPNCILINHLNPICESKYIHYCDNNYFSLENIWAAVNCNLNLVWQIWCHINVRIHLTEGSSKKNPLLHSQALHYYKPSCWFITSPVVLNHRLVTVETYASCHQSSAATDTLLLHMRCLEMWGNSHYQRDHQVMLTAIRVLQGLIPYTYTWGAGVLKEQPLWKRVQGFQHLLFNMKL